MDLETTLLERFIVDHPSDAARLIEAMPFPQSAQLLGELSIPASEKLLPRLVPIVAANAMERLEAERTAELLSAAPRDAAAGILRAMQSTRRSEVLGSLSPKAQQALKPLLRYAGGCAGALMDSEVLFVVDTLSAGEALERLRSSPQHALYYVYVVDDAQSLVGVVNMRELMEARPEEPIGLRATSPVESLPARSSSESIVAHPGWKRFHALPVVDAKGRFLGVIRYESVRELEGRLLDSGSEDAGIETAAALGELYSLGIRGLLEWGVSALLGPDERERRKR